MKATYWLIAAIVIAASWLPVERVQAQSEDLNAQAVELHRQGRYREAIPIATQALEQAEAQFGPEHRVTAQALNNLALLYQSMGRYEDALPLYRRALAICEQVVGLEHPDTALTLNNLAALHGLMGRYGDALPLIGQALTIRGKAFGWEHPDTAASLNHLADLQQSMGLYENALPVVTQSLVVREKVLGSEHPDTATSLHSLAVLYQLMGRYEDALPLFERAVRIREKTLGLEHPDTAVSLNHLADLHHAMGRSEDALALISRALGVRRKVFGDIHPHTAATVDSLAWLYQSLGRYDEALRHYSGALTVREKVLGYEHPHTAISSNSLAWLYQSLGRYDDAERFYKRSLAIREKALGWEHPDTAATLDSLAWLYQTLGQLDDALDGYRRSLAIREKVLGREHPDTVTTVNSLAALYQAMGRHDESLPLFLRALETRERTLGSQHLLTAISLNGLAALYASMGRYDDALLSYRRAVRIVYVTDISDTSQDHHAIEHLALFSSNLAGFLEKNGGQVSIDEAIIYYKLSVNARQRLRAGTRGLDKPLRDSLTQLLADPYRQLSRLLIQRGRIAEAESVLLLLKESELTEFLRRNGGSGSSAPSLIWTPAEEEYRRDLDRVAAEWRDYGQRRRAVDDRVKRREITATTSEVRDLDAQRNRLERRTNNILADARARLVEASRRASESRTKSFDTAPTGLSKKLDEVQRRGSTGTRTAALVLLPDSRGLSLIVTTNEGSVPLLRQVSEAELNALVGRLRAAITNRQDYRQSAEALYRHLIEPAEAQIGKQAGVRQLAILPFGSLRDLPFAALINPADGRHLIEQYALVALTADGSGGFHGLETLPAARWTGVALGASQPDPEFGNLALPGVRREVCGVVRDQHAGPCRAGEGVVDGQRYLDAAFTPEILRRLMSPGDGIGPNFLHIATHYNAEKSLLLLGDGSKLGAADIVAWNPYLGHYDLIALSACDSGVSEAAIESLGAMFRSQGAKAVLATLWSVADVGAAPLMIEFYRLRGERQTMSKAAALRQAQLAMLGGKLKAEKAGIDLRHPYFWAPYVLMGNWL
ncbi:MAG: tetratricopeptide repeat protein [Candidatus Accumulibacter sp.]|nr:tetratricopeptide repeat protein [Accumulibacter sp.]